MPAQQSMSAKDIRTGDKFLHDGQEYTAETYAQIVNAGWVRIPLLRWRVADPRALRLRKDATVTRLH